MKKLAIIAMGLIFTGCMSPTGTMQLTPQLEADREAAAKPQIDVSQGRPVFVEITSYPQLMKGGHIWLGGRMLVNIGREELSLNSIVDHYNQDTSE